MLIKSRTVIETKLITVSTNLEDVGDVNYKLIISQCSNNLFYMDVYRLELYRLSLMGKQEYSDDFLWIYDYSFNNQEFSSKEALLHDFNERLNYYFGGLS